MSVSWPFSGRRLATVTTRRIGRPDLVGAGPNAAQSTPFAIVRIFACGHAFASQLCGRRRRVRDHERAPRGRRTAGRQAGRASCPASPARADLPTRTLHPGQRRRRQAEDVRVELAGMHDARVDAGGTIGRTPAPAEPWPARPKAVDRERGDRGHAIHATSLRARRAGGSTRRGRRTRCGRAGASAPPSAARFRRRRSWSGGRRSDTVDLATLRPIEQAQCH